MPRRIISSATASRRRSTISTSIACLASPRRRRAFSKAQRAALCRARREGPARAAMSVNNITALQRAVETGVGIAVLPDYLIEAETSGATSAACGDAAVRMLSCLSGGDEERRAGPGFSRFPRRERAEVAVLGLRGRGISFRGAKWPAFRRPEPGHLPPGVQTRAGREGGGRARGISPRDLQAGLARQGGVHHIR